MYYLGIILTVAAILGSVVIGIAYLSAWTDARHLGLSLLGFDPEGFGIIPQKLRVLRRTYLKAVKQASYMRGYNGMMYKTYSDIFLLNDMEAIKVYQDAYQQGQGERNEVKNYASITN